MKLQILIPQYLETEAIIKPLLDSIEIQQNVNLLQDIGVIIVNDGTDVKLSSNFLNQYSYKIDYYQHEHNGVSATRNACLDYATADYVMFCDADDMFYNVCGLHLILSEINRNVFDSFVSVFVEETRIPGTNEPIYVNHEMDSTFVHGKVHRRQYLIEQNIRWNEALTIHEDSYFNILCQSLSDNVIYCAMPFYLWKWRDDSVCRGDFKYILKTYRNMIDSNEALIEELISRHKQDMAKEYVTMMIFDAYFTMNKEEWINQENKEYRYLTEKRFQSYYQKFKSLYETISTEAKTQIIMGIKNRMYNEGLLMESITFEAWIKQVEVL